MAPNGFTKAWGLWALGVALGFSIIELKALREPDGATLTSHLYHLGGFDRDSTPARLRRAALYAACAWVPVHVHRHARRCVSAATPPITPS